MIKYVYNTNDVSIKKSNTTNALQSTNVFQYNQHQQQQQSHSHSNRNISINSNKNRQTVVTPMIQLKQSFSLAIHNSDEPISNYFRLKSKSLSGTEHYCDDWFTNFQNHKAYKMLPAQKKKKGEMQFLIQQTPILKSRESNERLFSNSPTLLSNENSSIIATSIVNSTNNKQQQKRKPIEEINEPFNNKQIHFLNSILTEEGLIAPEMDEATINTIINSITYIRVRQNVIIFTRDNDNDNIYYIIDRGKLEYDIDGEVYELSKHECIGTRALIKNSTTKCYLKAAERSYLYRLPIEQYKTIAQDFMDKQLEERRQYISNTFFFGNLSKPLIESLANKAVKQKYFLRTELIKEDRCSQYIYIIIKGSIICTKGDIVVRKLTCGDIFGEICLFNQIESLYGYTCEAESEVLVLYHDDIVSSLGKDAIKDLVFSIFAKAVKDSDKLNKVFKDEMYMKLFNCFQLKFYFNDIIHLTSQKKIIIIISGTAFKTKFQLKEFYNLYQKKQITKKNILHKGKAFIDSITTSNDIEYNILGDECIVFESEWDTIVKSFTTVELYTLYSLLKYIPLFKIHNDYVNFQIVNAIKIETFQDGKVLLKNGPSSDKFFIIKSGKVLVYSNDSIIKTLDKNKSFGDITSESVEYTRHADFISSGKVECYVVDKAMYEQLVVNNDQVYNSVKELMVMNHLTISLDNLYYIKELGHGAYGKVYLVHDKNHFYAMKTAEIEAINEKKEMAEMYINEKQIMSEINHPFIVNLYNTYKTRRYLYFLMEHVDGQSLKSIINHNKKNDTHLHTHTSNNNINVNCSSSINNSISIHTHTSNNNINNFNSSNLNEVWFYGAILFTVLSYLQSNKIIHRDLKPENILIQNNGYLKVIDFGVAKKLTNDKDYASTIIGSVYYMSPEVILGKNYNYSVDYWSVGIILYELFYGEVPFGYGVKDPQLVYKEITEKKLVLQMDVKSNNEFNTMIKGLLNKNPNKRITSLQKVKALGFYAGFDFDKIYKMKIEPPRKIESKINEDDLSNVNLKFMNFMKNNVSSSSNELDNFMKNKEYEYFNDF